MDQEIQQQKQYRLVIQAVASSAYAEGDRLEIEAVECLRHLPGRRSVWRALCQGQTLLLKVYDIHAKQGRDADREWQHSTRLYQDGLAVAAPLFMASSDDGLMAVAYEFIAKGRDLAEHLGNADESERNDALRQLIQLHVLQHELGCFQSDDHLGNYLWSQGRLWMLDVGSCVFDSAPLGEAERIRNMAMLAANIPLPLRAAYDERLVDEYAVELPGLGQAISGAIRKRIKKYFKKTRRACSEFEYERRSGSAWLACRDIDPEIKRKLVEDPDQFFGAGKDMIKNGHTCSVVGIEENEKSYILKRYNRKPLGYRLLHMLMTPRALSNWSNGHVLRLFGIATPRPLACYTFTVGPLFSKGYLLMEKIPGVSLHKVNRADVADSRNDIPGQFVRLRHELDAIKAVHGDMKASNFILDDSGELQLIDLDSLVFHVPNQHYEREKAKDLARFLRNWQDCPELLELFRSELAAISE